MNDVRFGGHGWSATRYSLKLQDRRVECGNQYSSHNSFPQKEFLFIISRSYLEVDRDSIWVRDSQSCAAVIAVAIAVLIPHRADRTRSVNKLQRVL